MLQLLFDHQTFSTQKYGGISRYFATLQNKLGNAEDIHAKTGLFYTNNYYLKDYPPSLNTAFGKLLLKKQRKIYKWNKKYSKYLVSKNNFDIFHPTYYDPYFIEVLKKPYVITVHDMIHELMPEYFSPSDIASTHKRQCIENAAHIIAISETTKRDLKDILNIPDERISVIYHGFQPANIGQHHDAEPPINLENAYLFYVGDRTGYKNFPRFIRAIASLLRTKNIKLICAGGGAFQYAETELFNRMKIKQQVSQISATDPQLNLLYQNAKAFIFPSLYEGFGMSILESFHNKCPIILSNTESFKEIAGDAAAYFNPYEEQSILQTIERVISDEQYAAELVEEGSKRLLNFTIEQCINKTTAVYKGLSL